MNTRALLTSFLFACFSLPSIGADSPKRDKASRKKAKPAEVSDAKTDPQKTEGADAAKPKPVIDPYPASDVVLAAMKKAANYFRRDVAFAGGYAWRWPTDLSIAHGENRSSPTLIMMQPPGTPAVGLAMLNAWKATGDKLFLQAAKEAAQSLIWCQLASGGWDSDFDFDPRKASRYHFRRDIEAGDTERGHRHGDSTLDDEKTQSALHFLLELAHDDACKEDAALKTALKFGLDGLLAAQAPNGGWGQHYDGPIDPATPVVKAKLPAEWPHIWPNVDYTRFYTLNDGNLLAVMRLLLRAHELDKDDRYLAAAKKLGDFLLLAQLPEPQPAWAQQYNEEMIPVWARKFEPPAVSSIESASAINALIDLWLANGDDKWIKTLPPAIAWLEKAKLPDGHWARFYELNTNMPLYCKAKTYEVTFDDSDLPTHYGFKIKTEFAEELDQIKKRLALSRDEWIAKKGAATEPKKWMSRAKGVSAKVVAALQSADKKTGIWLADDMIDAHDFVRNLNAMSSYIESSKNAGAAFETFRSSEAAKQKKPAAQ